MTNNDFAAEVHLAYLLATGVYLEPGETPADAAAWNRALALITKRNKEREEVGGVNLFHVVVAGEGAFGAGAQVHNDTRPNTTTPTAGRLEAGPVRITFRNPRMAAIAAKHFPQAAPEPMGYEAGLSADQWEAFLAERAQEERDSWAVR